MGLETRVFSLVRGFLLLVLVGTVMSVASHAEQKTGVVKDFQLKDLEGKVRRFSSVPGKAWMIDFWATWCPPCKKEIPDLVALQGKYGPQGLKIIGISVDEEGAKVVKPFVQEQKINYLILLGDDTIQKQLDVEGYPTTFLLGPDRSIRKTYVGITEKKVFEKDIQTVLAEKGR